MIPGRVEMLKKTRLSKYEELGQTRTDIHWIKIVKAIHGRGRSLKFKLKDSNNAPVARF